MIADVETFVIRIWTPDGREDDSEPGRLRGVVEHIGSGEHGAFRGSEELVAFFVARLGGPAADVLAMGRNR
jgi:hypothetical protein